MAFTKELKTTSVGNGLANGIACSYKIIVLNDNSVNEHEFALKILHNQDNSKI